MTASPARETFVPQQRSNSVDMLLVLRAVACLMVILSHCWWFVPQDKFAQVGWYFRSSGASAVWIFFTLSGYLMGKGFWSKRYQTNWLGSYKFFFSRALRIIPPYVLVIAVLYLLGYHRSAIIQELPRLFTFTLQTSPKVLGVYWSISTEVQFYLFVPILAILLIPLLTSWKRVVIALLAAIIIPLLINITLWNHVLSLTTVKGQNVYWANFQYRPLYTNSTLFLIGFLLNPIIVNLQGTIRIASRYVVTAQIALLGILYLLTTYVHFHWYWTPSTRASSFFALYLPLLCALLSALFIYLSEQTEYYAGREKLCWKSCRRNVFRIFEWLGIFTYCMYLCHEPIIYTLHRYFTRPILGPGALLLYAGTTTLLTILAAAIIHFLIERPLERLKAVKRQPTPPLNADAISDQSSPDLIHHHVSSVR